MEIDKDLGNDFKVSFVLTGGKVQLIVEFDGVDAELDMLKTKLPSWAGPLVDLVKMEVDKP